MMIEKKFKKKKREFGSETLHSRSREKVAPTHIVRDQVEMVTLRTTNPSRNTRTTMRRQRRTWGNGASTIKSLGTTLKNVAPSSHSWPN
jgi:hypothetical protein